jgi:hypothetical protein
MTTKTQKTQSQEIESQETETTETTETTEQYLRRLYFDATLLKDTWLVLKEIKLGKQQYQNLFVFSWHPSVLYACDTIPKGLGQPRDYDQFVEFLSSSKMVLLGKIDVSFETGEPTLKTYTDNQIQASAESTISELLDPKILKKLIIHETCIEPDLWAALNVLYTRLNGHTVDLKQVTAKSVCTPTLKAIGAYKKALKGAMDF